MTVRAQTYNTKTVAPSVVTISGSFAGIDGATPTTVVGKGFTVARSAEGVWVVTFEAPLAGFISAQCWVNVASAFHTVSWATSAANRTLTITHITCAFANIVTGPAADDVAAEIGFRVDILTSDTGVVTGI